MTDTLNQLLEVIANDHFQGVNARNLHQALGVGRDFSHWIKARLKKGQFVEEEDFIIVQNIAIGSPKLANQKGGNKKAVFDYLLSIDTAKHLCLMENNEKGQIIRRYFIEAEKQLAKIAPKVQRRLLATTAERLATIDHQKEMTSALKDYLNRQGIEAQSSHYAQETAMIEGVLLDCPLNNWKEAHGIPKKQTVRDRLSPAELDLLAELEKANTALLKLNKPPHQRKQELEALADRLNPERVKQRHARQAKVKAGLAQLMAVLIGSRQ